jgi:hypothetical protein
MYLKGTIRDTVLLIHFNVLRNLQWISHQTFIWGTSYLDTNIQLQALRLYMPNDIQT